MNTEEIIEELEETATRILDYLKETELRGKTENNSTYTKQHGKVYAYLYFLSLLEDWPFLAKIQRERGMVVIDEKAGEVKEYPLHLFGWTSFKIKLTKFLFRYIL